MSDERTRVGRITVRVSVSTVGDPARELRFDAMVDTGAFGLVLPRVWKERLGPWPEPTIVEVETADQRIVAAEVCGPVRIQLSGFRKIFGEVVFMDMRPGEREFEPLVGYTILELCGAVADMVTHRLIARKYFDMKTLGRAGAGRCQGARSTSAAALSACSAIGTPA